MNQNYATPPAAAPIARGVSIVLSTEESPLEIDFITEKQAMASTVHPDRKKHL